MKKPTVAELAKYIGVTQPFLSQIKTGTRRFSGRKACEISKVTGVPLERLLAVEGREVYRSIMLAYGYQNHEDAIKEERA